MKPGQPVEVASMLPAYYEFQNPVKIISGRKALENLPYELDQLGARKPLIVTDPGVVRAGLVEQVIRAFAGSGFTIGAVFDQGAPGVLQKDRDQDGRGLPAQRLRLHHRGRGGVGHRHREGGEHPGFGGGGRSDSFCRLGPDQEAPETPGGDPHHLRHRFGGDGRSRDRGSREERETRLHLPAPVAEPGPPGPEDDPDPARPDHGCHRHGRPEPLHGGLHLHPEEPPERRLRLGGHPADRLQPAAGDPGREGRGGQAGPGQCLVYGGRGVLQLHGGGRSRPGTRLRRGVRHPPRGDDESVPSPRVALQPEQDRESGRGTSPAPGRARGLCGRPRGAPARKDHRGRCATQGRTPPADRPAVHPEGGRRAAREVPRDCPEIPR